MPAIVRAAPLLPLLCSLWVIGPAASTRADAPPPSQALASDPERPRPSLGLSADGAAIVLGDYAARLELALVPAISLGLVAGASHRRGTDDVLIEVAVTLWPLGLGLEGPHATAVVGAAWAGPWSQAESVVLRLGAEAGWQFLWESVSITLAAGAHASHDPAAGAWSPEPRARVALGLVL